jgi:hypothetical protein
LPGKRGQHRPHPERRGRPLCAAARESHVNRGAD